MSDKWIVLVSPFADDHPTTKRVFELAEYIRQQQPTLVITGSLDQAKRNETRRMLRKINLGADAAEILDAAVLALPVGILPARASIRAGLRTLFQKLPIEIVHIADPFTSDLTRVVTKLWGGLITATQTISTDSAKQVFREKTRERLNERIDLWVDGAVEPEQVLREFAALRSKIHKRPDLIEIDDRSCVIDLHMHTSHSWDCATDPAALLYIAREVGLTSVAVTDHNEISGALECASVAEEFGIQVIVGEEVKTNDGEVIGLFLEERIEPGLSWEKTIELIREQDGLVYVPHPFDRLHTIPEPQLLRETIDEIDAFETYNARLPFDQYNREAEQFAKKYNLIEGAGSDAHVVQGLGTAAVHMPAWDDRESFLNSLAQGEILRRPKSLLYLQGLKWVNDLSGRSRRTPS